MHTARMRTKNSLPLECSRPPAGPFKALATGGSRSSTGCATICASSRREAMVAASMLPILSLVSSSSAAELATTPKYEYMESIKDKDYGKARSKYPDYVETASGLQYKDLRDGSGATPKPGDTCVIDWDGYTIGYYGRPFEARNKPKGSSFTGDNKEYYRFKLGQRQVIPAMEEAIASMKVGGIRRIIVPVELGYPQNAKGLPDFRLQGPKPSTFAGERALDFVLKNQGLVDKTLLLDIELISIRDN